MKHVCCEKLIVVFRMSFKWNGKTGIPGCFRMVMSEKGRLRTKKLYEGRAVVKWPL